MNHVRSFASCLVAVSCMIVACGADDDDDNGTGGTSGKGGSAGSAGKGGSSGKGGSAGKGGTGGSSGGSAGAAVGGEGGDDALGGQGGEAGASAGAAGSPEGGMGGESGEAGAPSAGTAGTGTAGTGGVAGTAGTGTAGTGTAGTAGMGGLAGTGGLGGIGGLAGTGGLGGGGAGGAGSGGIAGTGGNGPVADTIDNPSFESGTNGMPPTNWTHVGDTTAAKYNWNVGNARTGNAYLDMWAAAAYTVDVSQVVSPIPNGTYTVSIWHNGIAYTEQYLYVTGHDESNPTAVLSQATSPSDPYVQVVIPNIPVTSGQIKIGIHSVGAPGSWSHFDDVSLTLVP